jgi:hypothetical protein
MVVEIGKGSAVPSLVFLESNEVNETVQGKNNKRETIPGFLESYDLGPHTANNFGFMYSRNRIYQYSFPNFIYIFPNSFTIFCQKLLDPKRNYENQI